MYNLRDDKGTLKAKVPNDVVWIIIQQQIVTFFADRRKKECMRVTQDTEMSCRVGPNSALMQVFLWKGDILEPEDS